MAARRYEICLLVLKKYFTRLLRLLVKYFLATREEKFRISNRPCNILLIYYINSGDILQNSENMPQGLYSSKAFFLGLIFGRAYIRRGLSTEGNLCFNIDWTSLIAGRKFTVFALFYFVFGGNFQVQAPRGLYYFVGQFNRGSFALRVFRGAYF